MPFDRRWELSTEHKWLKEKVDRQWKEAGESDKDTEGYFISLFHSAQGDVFVATYVEGGYLRVLMKGSTAMVTRHPPNGKLVPPYLMTLEERSWFQACAITVRLLKEREDGKG